MMMPIAHASTALSGNATGLFAALCTANGLVYLDSATGEYVKDKKTDTHHLNTSNKCPLCFIVEQNTLSDTPQQITAAPSSTPEQYVLAQADHHVSHEYATLPIRAPPQHS
jgi:hypothetical protein